MLNRLFYPPYLRVQWLYNFNFSNKQCTDITGGWELCYGVSSSTSTHLDSSTDLNSHVGGMYFRTKKENSTSTRYYGVATQNPINTARYRKLTVRFNTTASSGSKTISKLQFYLTTNKTYPSAITSTGNHVGGAGITLATGDQIQIGDIQTFTANLPSTAIDSKYYLVLMVSYSIRNVAITWTYNQIYLTK